MLQNMPKKGNPALWIILIVVVLIAVAAILYFGDFFNANSNTNTVANTNTETNTIVKENVDLTLNTEIILDTTDWKTYNNSNFKYSIKYPSNWIVKESDSLNIGPYVSVLPPNWEERSTLETGPGIMINKVAEIPSGDLVENTQTVSINNYHPIRQIENGLKATYVTYFSYNDEFISVSWDEEFGDQPDYPIYETILSTFTFTVNTSSWFEYNNTKYGYSIKIPNDWVEIDALTGDSQSITKTNQELSYLTIQNSKNNDQEVTISIDEVGQDNVPDYINYLAKLNNTEEGEYIVKKLHNPNNAEGYEVYIPEYNNSILHLEKNNYFFWHNDRILSVKMMNENENNLAIVNSLKLN